MPKGFSSTFTNQTFWTKPNTSTTNTITIMKLYKLISFLIFWFTLQKNTKSDIHIGYRLTLPVPEEYSEGFNGKAYLIETDNLVGPKFRAALSVEAVEGNYSCSLQVFLGDVKVWSSGHYWRFDVKDKCVLELTRDGDLQLKGPKERLGWRTGTSGQGVERLQILSTGNLVLVDTWNQIKWQSFNFPTNVLLWSQKLDVATRLTSLPKSNSSSFYSFEVRHDKIALYLNSGHLKYSYWEFKPTENRNITHLELNSKALDVFNDKYHKIAQIPSKNTHPLRFMAFEKDTGNIGLYFFRADTGKFEASFEALNTTCDLPLACEPYNICTITNSCSCIHFSTKEDNSCDVFQELCGGGGYKSNQVEMLELDGITTVLVDIPKMINISKEACSSLCIKDCKCLSALYSSRTIGITECYLYGVVIGVKQVETGTGLSYMIKVPKGTQVGQGKSNVKKWVLVLVGVVDVAVILIVLAGTTYYFIWKRRKSSAAAETDS